MYRTSTTFKRFDDPRSASPSSAALVAIVSNALTTLLGLEKGSCSNCVFTDKGIRSRSTTDFAVLFCEAESNKELRIYYPRRLLHNPAGGHWSQRTGQGAGQKEGEATAEVLEAFLFLIRGAVQTWSRRPEQGGGATM